MKSLDTTALIRLYQRTRATTLQIVSTLEIEDFVIQTAEFMSPPRWHLGHTTWLFEILLGQFAPGRTPYRDDFLFYFNSYYNRFGERIERGRRGSVSRPTVAETQCYRRAIDDQVLEFLQTPLPHAQETEQQRLFRMGIEHEMQHQELLICDIKHLLGGEYRLPQLGATLGVGPKIQSEPPQGRGLKIHLFRWKADFLF